MVDGGGLMRGAAVFVYLVWWLQLNVVPVQDEASGRIIGQDKTVEIGLEEFKVKQKLIAVCQP